ncbi:flippase [Tateyamaria sp.]|uniref:flippase n=1 Tax=Tateyamaria sp. TaxID=1929288 RepID=UPI00329C14C7
MSKPCKDVVSANKDGQSLPPTPVPSKKQILNVVSSSLLVRVLSVLAGLASTVALARVLGPSEYGIYAFALATLAILAVPVQVGLPTLVLRVTAQANASEEWSVLRGIWTWATLMTSAGTLVVIGLVLTWLAIAGDKLTDEERQVILIGLPLVPLFAAERVRAAALRGLKHIWASGFPGGIFRPVLLAFLVLGTAAIAGKQSVTAVVALILAGIAAAAAFGLGALLILKLRPSGMNEFSSRQFKHREWLRSIGPLSLIAGLQILMQNFDFLMLGLMRGNDEVGQYRIAVSVASLAIFNLTVINFVVQPYFAEAHARNEQQRLQRIAGASAMVAFGSTAVILPLVWFAGEWGLTWIFGAGYVEAFIPLIILMLGQSVSAYFGSVGNLLTMGGYERRNLRTAAIATVANIALNGALIPIYGTTGAAIATGSSIGVLNLLLWLEARKILRIDSSPFGTFKKVE